MLEERLRFETLLSELSAGLIHLPAGAIDAALVRALQQVGVFLGVDLGSVDVYAGGEPGIRVSWARPGLEEPPRVMDADKFPWAAKRDSGAGTSSDSLGPMSSRKTRRSIAQATSVRVRGRRFLSP